MTSLHQCERPVAYATCISSCKMSRLWVLVPVGGTDPSQAVPIWVLGVGRTLGQVFIRFLPCANVYC